MRISGTSTREATRLISSSKAQSAEARSSTSTGSLSPSSSESVRSRSDDPLAHGDDAGVALVEPGLLDRPHHRLAVGAGDLALELEAELAVDQQVGVAVGLRLEVHHPRGGAAGEDLGAPLGVEPRAGLHQDDPSQRESSSSSSRSRTSRA